MTNLMKRFLLALLAVAALASCNQPYHPEWTYNSVVYEVNVRQFSPEGTFKGVEGQLPRLKDLGVYCKTVVFKVLFAAAQFKMNMRAEIQIAFVP